MTGDAALATISQALTATRPDMVWSSTRADPRLLLWAALFALGSWLLLAELTQARRRPALLDQFARQDLDRRLRESLEVQVARSLGVRTLGDDRPAPSQRSLFPPVLKRMLRPVLDDLGWLVRGLLLRFAPGLAGGAELERDLRLVRSGGSVAGYFAEKVGAGLLWFAFLPVLAALGGPRTPALAWLAAGVVGFLLPDLELRRRLGARRERIVAELPALLDQLVISSSAGLSLEQALDQTAAASDGIVSEELRRLVTELGVGRWRSLQDGLDGLDRRNGVPELTTLIGQLRAAHRQGVPYAQVLTAQADALRERRRALIVEAGGRATVRMVIPIALFVLPVLVIVVLVPAAVQLLQLRG
jgi:tight adherence protein C